MIEIVKDYEGGTELLRQIDNTQSECILVTPYVQLWDRVRDALTRAKNRNVTIKAYIRKPESEKEQDKAIKIGEELAHLGVEVRMVPNLHAKVYTFDNAAIVSSMNLYEFSQLNSIELSVLIKDPALITQIKNYITDFIDQKASPLATGLEKSKTISGFCIHCGKQINYPEWGKPVCRECYLSQKASETDKAFAEQPKNQKPAQSKAGAALGFITNAAKAISESIQSGRHDRGFCIRCGTGIENDPYRPLCPACYAKWAVYENPNYTEQFCLACGQPSKTSMAKPYCRGCYRNGQ